MDRGGVWKDAHEVNRGQWTKVMTKQRSMVVRQRWLVDRGGKWTEVVSGRRW